MLLRNVLMDTLHKLECYRREHPNATQDIATDLDELEGDIRWLLRKLGRPGPENTVRLKPSR